MANTILKKIYDESGLLTLASSPRDAHLLIIQRSLRLLVYGQSALVLTAFLKALAFTEIQMGVFMTLTLLGDAGGSLVLTLYADRVGRARILILGSWLMVLSGVVFALFEMYIVLLVAAMVGVITPRCEYLTYSHAERLTLKSIVHTEAAAKSVPSEQSKNQS